MRFKTGVVVGFAVGYYLGAKAGRERYLEIRAWLHGPAADKARAVIDLGVERARDLIESDDEENPAAVIDLAAGARYSPSR